MSKKVRILICSVLVLFAFGAGVFAYAHTQWKQNNTANAEEDLLPYLVNKDGKIKVPAEPAEGDPRNSRGTADNPFFILEIVPYDGIAEFGYHISGCEPLDVDAMARDGMGIPFQEVYYDTQYNVTYRFWPEDKPATFTASEAATKLHQYGTMTYVGTGGNYNIVGSMDAGVDKKAATYEAAANGAFSWKPLSAEECFAMTTPESKAPYEGEFTGALTVGTSFKMCFKDMTYVEGTGNKVTHKNVFLKESVGLRYDLDANGVRYEIPEAEMNEKIKNYKSVVYTVTPEDLNMNPELVDRADLVVISPQMNESLGSCPDGMYTYVQPGDSGSEDKYKYLPYLKKHLFGYEEPAGDYGREQNVPGASFKTNLLDWSIVEKIAGRAMDETHMLPVIMENKIYQNAYSGAGALVKSGIKMKVMYADGSVEDTSGTEGTQENMAKLYLLLNQMKTSTFKTLYGNPGDSSNALFTSQDLVLSGGAKVEMKNGHYLQTGVFNYDLGRADNMGDADSKAYWNDKTLLPWHLLPTTGYTPIERYSKEMAVFGIAVASGDGYNMTSGEAQYSLRNGLMSMDDNGNMSRNFDTNPCGIKNGIFGAQLYEFFDSINGAAPVPGESDLTTADALYYLLNGVNGGPTPVNDTTVYKILELQPSSLYETDTNPLFWKMIISTYTNSIVDPEVKRMTTSEFIGSHVECISEYDLVYVGMRKSFTDPAMQFAGATNFVYAHTGPKVTVGTSFRGIYGWLRNGEIFGISDNDYNRKEENFVYSGNDLTQLALKKLEDYNEAGFPILFGSGFYSSHPGSGYTMAGTIDRNSNIYELGGIIDDAGSKAMSYGELNGAYPARAAQFMHTLSANSNKVQMVFYQSPVLYDSTKPNVSDRYINGYSEDRTLRYRFYVKAPAGSSYQVKLYVDTNTDGAYTPGTEDLDLTVLDSGNHTVAGGIVEAGGTYTVKREISNRIGSIPWKLDLVKDGKVYASQSGVSAIQKGVGDDAITIKVLQIVPSSRPVSLSLPTEEEIEANSLSGTALEFYTKISALDCFDIQFVRMNQTQIKNIIEGVGGAPQPDYLYQNYDMLVLGFADMYDGVSEEILLNKIADFIDRGKAVLYTHDTSSTIGKTGMGNTFDVWGSNVTKKYRDMFGMDRYGAKKYLDEGSMSAEGMDQKDKPYTTESSSGSAGQLHKNEDGVPLIQGLSNGLLFRATNSHIRAYEVSRVNQGAITQYPYTIPANIPVAMTHPQYYQLDMEKEDVVVWYCLDGGTTGNTDENLFFGQNKNDVRNNYYIYNIGNVTYSGMGHMDGGTPNALALEDLEIELFINTFVAAYRAPAESVPIKVVNDDVTANYSGEQFLCVDVDSANATESIGIDVVDSYRLMTGNAETGYTEVATPVVQKSKRVYFKLDDANAYGNDTIYKLSMKLNGTDTLLAIYKKDGNKFMNTVQNDRKFIKGEIYYVDVPITIDTSGGTPAVGKTELDITVEMRYFVGAQPHDAEPRITKIDILPRGLYDLH